MNEFVNERMILAEESRTLSIQGQIWDSLVSPHGAQAFARRIDDPEYTLGRLLCQCANLKSDAEFGSAARMVLVEVVGDAAKFEASMVGPQESDYEYADHVLRMRAA